MREVGTETGSAAEPSARSAHPDVVLCPGGPMLLRGEHTIEDAEGTLHTTTRAVSAVCRCGRSETQPWCDGTHKVLPRKLRP